MKARKFGLKATAILILAIASSTFAVKISNIHEGNYTKSQVLPQNGTWKCKVSPSANGTLGAGFCLFDTLYGYVVSSHGVAKCGSSTFATTGYDFKSYSSEMTAGELSIAEGWTSDETSPPQCPNGQGN